MQIQCVDNEGDFLSLRNEWDALWRRSVNPSYFLSHDWVRCCWQELQSTSSMRIFVVRKGTEPVLIAPCMRSRTIQTKLPVNLLSFIEHPETQIADIVCMATAEAEEGFLTLIRYLLRELSSDWDLLAFNKIPGGSPMAQWLEKIQDSSKTRCQLRSGHQALVIPLGGSWEQYLMTRSARFRKTLRNIVNRIQRMGKVEVECYRATDIASDAIRKLFAVSDASWKISNGVAITSSKRRKRFFEELFKAAVTTEGVRIWILEVNGDAVASETQVADGQTVYALRSDYNERYADSSPGVYLQMEILKELFGSSYQEYNFGVGLNPYKTRWADQHVQLMNFRLYNETFYGRLLRSMDHYKFSKISQFPGLRVLNGLFAEKSL
jgi:CelD/BcsL family acetyltransferase involved in cellulose biosynthesis